MTDSVYTSVPYAVARVGIWALLLAAALTDGFWHRRVRSRGWQLYALLCGAVALFVVRNLAFLAMVVEGKLSTAGAVHHTYFAYIFFSDFADAYWIFVLLALSAGLCITRDSLGQHRAVCIVVPVIFGLASLVVDYVLFSTSGLGAFDQGVAEGSRAAPADGAAFVPTADGLAYIPTADGDPVMDTGVVVADSGWGLAFVICFLMKFMSFFMAWFYMYDTARTEWESLRAPDAQAQADAADAAAAAPGLAPGDAGVGHRALPTNAALLEEGQNASHMYGDVVSRDLDAPKTVQDRIADRDKERLMRSFFYAICVYIVAAFAVFLLPALAPSAAALLVVLDCLLWVFAAALLWVFRLRAENQFLLLDEGLGGVETTTELGVLNQGDEEEDGGGGGGRVPAKPPRFTLQDEEEGGGGSGGVNATAAAHGVVVRTLHSPHV